MTERASDDRLRLWERCLIAALLIGTVAFGCVVQYRAAHSQRRMGDLGCFLRGGWAVWTGANIYDVTCDNGWHYNYPPLYAILMVPFADPPRGREGTGLLPYEVSVASHYLLAVLCLVAAMHGLAAALERRSADPAIRNQTWRSRRWWFLRLAPTLACLPPVGHTLARGQVNLLLLLLVCGMIVSSLRGRRLTAGMFLAGAICLKIIPAFLLIYPAWRRDGRCLAGCALGLVLGLGVVPLLAMGPQRTAQSYADLGRVLIGPALGVGNDTTRLAELTSGTLTNNHSLQAMIHWGLHPDPDKRPREPSTIVRRAHWLLGGFLTLVILASMRPSAASDSLHDVLSLSALCLVMLLVSPVFHSHYLTLAAPLLMTLLAIAWERDARRGVARAFLDLPAPPGWVLLVLVQLAANLLPLMPTTWGWTLREAGLAGYGTLLLWTVAATALWRERLPHARLASPWSPAHA